MTNLISQNLDAIETKGLPGLKGNKNIADFVSNSKIMNYVFYLCAFLLLVYMLMGGLQLMLAKGDPKAVAGAWAKITNAVIGFVIVFLAYFLTSLFAQIFGLSGFGGVFN